MRITTAIVLAAGRGERMRPLTDHCPKPLLAVGGRPLIAWHLQALARAGVRDVVINTAWLASQFEPALGDGSRWGLRLHWSMEGRDHGAALETAGGIAKALPALGEVFWVVSGDVLLPAFDFEAAAAAAASVVSGHDAAHLWLAPNAPHHPRGDFALDGHGRVRALPGKLPGQLAGQLPAQEPGLTWASVGVFRREMFSAIAPGTRLALRPLLDEAIAHDRLGGSRLSTPWIDVGTPQRLAEADAACRHAGLA